MPSDLVLVAIIANISVVVAAWISAHKKLTHITKVTNSNLKEATDKVGELEAKIHDLRDGELKAAMVRIDKMETEIHKLSDTKR